MFIFLRSTNNNIITSGEAILSAYIVENLWAVWAPPRTPLGSSQRSHRVPLLVGRGLLAPPEEPHLRCWPHSPMRHLYTEFCLNRLSSFFRNSANNKLSD